MALTPTGDSKQGLGTNHWSIDPLILDSTQLGERANIEAAFGAVIPTDGSAGLPTSSPDKFAGKVIYYGVGPSVDIYTNGITHVAPVVELVGWHVVDGFSTATAVRPTAPTSSISRSAGESRPVATRCMWGGGRRSPTPPGTTRSCGSNTGTGSAIARRHVSSARLDSPRPRFSDTLMGSEKLEVRINSK